MTTTPNNPLLDQSEFFNYPTLTPEDVLPGIEQVTTEARKRLETVLSEIDLFRANAAGLRFEQVLFPLIEIEHAVSRAWAPVNNLLSLEGAPALRAAADKARPLIVSFHNDMQLDPRVFEAVSLYASSDEGKTLTGERARLVENTLRDLRLSGAGLPEEQKAELRELNLRLADLSRRYTDNITDSKFELILTEERDLEGLPDYVVSAARHQADKFRERAGEAKVPAGAALFNLDYPSYVPFIRYSERGDLRKKIAFEFLQQGTERATFGVLGSPDGSEKSLDNQPLLREICQLKARKASLLGFKNFAELSLTPKMAKQPAQVFSFLQSLAKRVRPIARKEYEALAHFQNEIGYKNTENKPDKIFPWDREFLSEKMRKARFDFDSGETKPYFELRQTLQGIFSLVETLFGATFSRRTDVPTWHADVEVYEFKNQQGEKRGTLYLDLFPREMKSQGAWVNPFRNGYQDSQGEQHHAQCILVCNVTPPTPDTPSLISFEEAKTLFHEFGHALHQLFSTVKLEPLSGLNVAYDFVELPSQLLENFCTEEISLTRFARHYKTGEVIPRPLIEKIKAAQRFLSGLTFLRQLEFGLFDMAVHTHEDPDSIDVDRLFRETIEQYGVMDYWHGTHFPCGFSHIFGGGYAAGYYSYKWSEVLEADAFQRFKESGVISPEVGREYRDKILAKGDSEDPMKLFVDFMGREPKEDALLEKIENTI